MSNLPSYLTFTVAVIVAWIGFQQFLLAREKFKLDLFEKRFAIYKATQKFLKSLGHPEFDFSNLVEFSRETQDAVFLFDEEIVVCLDTLYNKANMTISIISKYKPLPVGSERAALCDREMTLRLELGKELLNSKNVFAPYLKFKVWK
jgi:hypothetical protein